MSNSTLSDLKNVTIQTPTNENKLLAAKGDIEENRRASKLANLTLNETARMNPSLKKSNME